MTDKVAVYEGQQIISTYNLDGYLIVVCDYAIYRIDINTAEVVRLI